MTTDLYSSANYQEALNGFDHSEVQTLAHQTLSLIHISEPTRPY